MTEPRGHITGMHQEHKVKLYALSTCIWCRKIRQFLESENVTFDFIYVDLLKGDEREAAKDAVRVWNPRVSFPTVVIDEATCVIGSKIDALRETLGL